MSINLSLSIIFIIAAQSCLCTADPNIVDPSGLSTPSTPPIASANSAEQPKVAGLSSATKVSPSFAKPRQESEAFQIFKNENENSEVLHKTIEEELALMQDDNLSKIIGGLLKKGKKFAGLRPKLQMLMRNKDNMSPRELEAQLAKIQKQAEHEQNKSEPGKSATTPHPGSEQATSAPGAHQANEPVASTPAAHANDQSTPATSSQSVTEQAPSTVATAPFTEQAPAIAPGNNPAGITTIAPAEAAATQSAANAQPGAEQTSSPIAGQPGTEHATSIAPGIEYAASSTIAPGEAGAGHSTTNAQASADHTSSPIAGQPITEQAATIAPGSESVAPTTLAPGEAVPGAQPSTEHTPAIAGQPGTEHATTIAPGIESAASTIQPAEAVPGHSGQAVTEHATSIAPGIESAASTTVAPAEAGAGHSTTIAQPGAEQHSSTIAGQPISEQATSTTAAPSSDPLISNTTPQPGAITDQNSAVQSSTIRPDDIDSPLQKANAGSQASPDNHNTTTPANSTTASGNNTGDVDKTLQMGHAGTGPEANNSTANGVTGQPKKQLDPLNKNATDTNYKINHDGRIFNINIHDQSDNVKGDISSGENQPDNAQANNKTNKKLDLLLKVHDKTPLL